MAYKCLTNVYISELFKEASKEEAAIIVLDELDLLIADDDRVARVLQENLDGINQNSNILVLAAANYIDDIPPAILRRGRFDSVLRVNSASDKYVIEMFKSLSNKFDITYNENIKEEDISHLFRGLSYVTLNAIMNDVVLRHGNENISMKNLSDSTTSISSKIKVLDYDEKEVNKEPSYSAAIHEASHCLVASLYKDMFVIKTTRIQEDDGLVNVVNNPKADETYDKVLANIRILMSGIIGEKIIAGKGGIGCVSDLDKARSLAYTLINRGGYVSCWEQLPDNRGREETFIKRRHNELKIERLLRKIEKQTVKIITDNKDKIIKLADRLMLEKRLDGRDVYETLAS